MWLGAASFGFRVVTDFQFLAGNGRTVRGGVTRRNQRAGHLIQLEKWHDSSDSNFVEK
jgi:hypothetical protein